MFVVALGEGGAPGFPHPGDDRDRRSAEPAPGQFVGGSVFQQAEQPELLAPGPVTLISYQPLISPCMASHKPPPENRGGGAPATASRTAANWARIAGGQPERKCGAGAEPLAAR